METTHILCVKLRLKDRKTAKMRPGNTAKRMLSLAFARCDYFNMSGNVHPCVAKNPLCRKITVYFDFKYFKSCTHIELSYYCV